MLEINFGIKINETDLLIYTLIGLIIMAVVFRRVADSNKHKSKRVYHVHFMVDHAADHLEQPRRNDIGEDLAWDFNNEHWAQDNESADEGVADM